MKWKWNEFIYSWAGLICGELWVMSAQRPSTAAEFHSRAHSHSLFHFISFASLSFNQQLAEGRRQAAQMNSL